MNESPQRLGKGMIYAAWLLALILLTLFFNHYLDKQQNPNQKLTTQFHQDGVREVSLKRNRHGHYVANGTINGQPVVFFLDTGATIVSIPEHIANALNLQKGRAIRSSTANGVITTHSTKLDSVALGSIELHGVRASINPYMSDNQILLGMSFLKDLDFAQRGNTLILRQYPN
ncbi:TIGR02281 family clan AA aspartic protease [Candidatus Parabeggiatoa sp. HSG14]|uniref:retropepsin-like aspartic protease family protein n=1 Tax=Candidatus Parabeggiatoa sp. HSG14 TaxID=3055593 RepID=UPI0025A719C9|nr:TIGR02281 family clan AA aspartic protease [Thiotrichales bacterium HSG14]